jgi:UDP-N-acetylmuramyl tripeptide synthase
MKISDFAAVVLGKAIVKVLRLLGRDAGNFPGLVLWTIDKNYLRHFSADCPIIAVTGTNGKTSTTNFLNKIFSSLPPDNGDNSDSGSKSVKKKSRKNGRKIITNMQGNNLDTGIGSLLLQHCNMFGRVHADYLVLEVDESHVPVVFKHLKLETLVILNFFRDQLDRNGEVETLICKVHRFLETYEGNLVLNADDPNVARLGRANPDNRNVYYYNVEKYEGATAELYEAGEGRFCPECGEELAYDYYQYSHIGRFHCPKCGYGNIEPDVQVKNLDFENFSFEIDGEVYHTKHPGIYHMYNLAAVYTAASLYRVSHEIIHNVFGNFEVNNGRLERFETDGGELLLNLAKNPVGANMTLRLMNQDKNDKELLFVLNDNIADGCDVSWIWDINFSVFSGVTRVVTSGTRAYDIAIRIKCSGYAPENISVCPDLDDAVATLFFTGGKKYAIANYTAVQPTRAAVGRYIGKNGGA